MRPIRLFALLSLTPFLLPALASAQVRRPLPVIQRVQPTSGPVGTEVTIVGRNFHDHQTVWLGETQLEVGQRLPNRWTVTIPEGARTGLIELRVPRGQLPGQRFRVTASGPAPAITGFSPSSGPPGAEVVIRGESFASRLADNHVFLGEAPVVVRNANPTELRVIVPAGAASATFRVRVTGAGEATSEGTFAVGTGTSIASFEPALGPPGTRVTIRGTGFHRAAARVRVYLGEMRARVIRASTTELTVEIPRRGAASGRFLVDVRGGGRAYSATEFAVRSPPTISGLEPTFGAPGTRVTVSGANFGTDIRQIAARIGETVLPIRDIADDRLVFEIPEGAAGGQVELTIEGLAPARSRAELRIVEPVAINGFSPRSGGAGTEVRILGRGFSTTASQNRVTMSGQACEIVRAGAEELVVRIPEASSGPFQVAVQNAGEVSTSQPFVVTRSPTIASFAPQSGAVGTEVTLTGRNFGSRPGLIEVRLGDRRLELSSASPTELVVRVPAGAETGRFRVTVRLQGSVTATRDFTVTE